MSKFLAIIARDMRLAFRGGGGAAPACAFFAITVLLFAFGIGPDANRLSALAPAIIWASALLATQISLEQIYRPDFEDGSLDILVETNDMLVGIALAKACAHWLSTGAVLLLIAPVLGLVLNLPAQAFGPLMISLIIGAPGLSLIGSFASALTLTLPRAGALVVLIVSPLYAPFLIFGSGAANAGAIGDPLFASNLMFLGACSLFAAVISPLASAAALRSNLSS